MEQVKLAIRYVVFVGGVVAYVYLYFTFLRDILDAEGSAPDLDNGAVQIASAIGGLLAATFAVAFGIQRRDPTVNEKRLNLGSTLTPNAELVTAVCLVVYFLVGLAATVVAFTNSAETPQEIKTPVTLFLGYLVAMFTGIVTGPGQRTN
jgi:hypothetical protein